MRKKLFALLLSTALTLALACPVYACESVKNAGNRLRQMGIYQGNNAGDLMLDKSLTRAELAVILTRIHGEGQVDPNQYTWACYYEDVPEWAKPYVGYCTANLLVTGYGGLRYGADDPVTPAAACTVVLRVFSYTDGESRVWSYDTACSYAVELGLIGIDATRSAEITRGDMAVLLCSAMDARKTQKDNPQHLPILPAEGVSTAADGTIISKVITQGSWSRQDFSQLANPDIFTGDYSREWYNAIRQSIVDQESILAGSTSSDIHPSYLYAHTQVPDQPAEAMDAFSHTLARISGYYDYTLSAEPYIKNQYEFPGYAIVKVSPGWSSEKVLEFIRPELDCLEEKTTRQQAIALNDYLCGLMEYVIGASAAEQDIFSPHQAPIQGRCSSYANAFSFLCGAAGIPCIIVSSENHSWNEVYVDGQWLTVDVSSNDVIGGGEQNAYLLTHQSPGIDRLPDCSNFARELLVPGSTIK